MRLGITVVTGLLLAVAGCGKSGPTDANAKKTAEFVLGRGGTVSVFGSDLPLKKGAEIPKAAFGVQRVDLNEKKVTDADLDQLAELKNIQYLGLYGATITPKGLEKILALKSLRELELSYTRLDDEGLKKLQALPKLEKVYVYGTKVTKDGAEGFSKAKRGCHVLR